jgi:hypothetical protein
MALLKRVSVGLAVEFARQSQPADRDGMARFLAQTQRELQGMLGDPDPGPEDEPDDEDDED